HAAIAFAVQDEFPLAYHAVCCRHLMMNLSLKRDKTKALFWRICKAYTTEEFSRSMRHLQDIQTDAKLPVLKLAETYRAMVQEWYYQRRKLTGGKQSAKKMMKSAQWVVCGVSDHQYQVYDGRYNRQVDFRIGTCQCRKWQLSGIPCGQVISVTRMGISPHIRKAIPPRMDNLPSGRPKKYKPNKITR
nr:transposase, MuDR, MULE transposase domain protein [Tanacetum cinerariifolium]